MSPEALPSRGLVFQLVCHFHRYWAYSSKSTVQSKMESCYQVRACCVCFLLQGNVPEITQLRSENTEKSGKLPKITQFRCGTTERPGNLPKITQLIMGSTERSGKLPKITQLRSGSTERKRKKVKLLSRVQLYDPMDCSLPGSSVHGIFQARILEWVAISFIRRSS